MRIIGKALLAALVTVTLVASASIQPAAASTGSDELVFAAKLNELRQSKGLAPLATKGALFDTARNWAGRMLVDGLAHNPSLQAQGPAEWVRLGENVGTGYDVQAIHDAFVASPAHYRNMVDPGFDSVGVGVMHAADGKIFVTVNFMTTAAPAAPAAPAAKAKATAKARTVCTRNSRGKVVCRRR